ncbi:hypothetical protein ACGF5O_26995 [Streptomyces sp. NPDC048291]|uniref:hypothetical protein n=1 Tax=Streptomyces sp. NPDC048291 TaxID=3365530 RepID=UPI00371688BB
MTTSPSYDTLLVEERTDLVVVTLHRTRSSATAPRLTKLFADSPGAHPVADDLAQTVPLEG